MSPPSGPWVPFLASGALSPGVPMRLSCVRGALGNKKLINSLWNIGHLSSEKSLYSLAQEWMNIAKICILTTKRLFGAQASYSILRFCLDLFPLSTPIIIIIHILMARSPMRMPSMQCNVRLSWHCIWRNLSWGKSFDSSQENGWGGVFAIQVRGGVRPQDDGGEQEVQKVWLSLIDGN